MLAAHAWIVDGATGISAARLTDAPSDAAWLAGAIGAGLERLSVPGRSAEKLISGLQDDIESAFSGMGLPGVDDHLAPSACLGLVGLHPVAGESGCRVEGRFLGDVVALVPSGGGIVRWTDERAKPFEEKTLAALGTGGHDPGRIPEAAQRQIRENRARLNRPDGYWVVHPRRPWAGRELAFETEIAHGETLVLASDGFMRLVDVFGAYTDATLHAALAAGHGDALMGELRALERRDGTADVFRRVKTHDDATVLVIATEAGD